MMGGATPGWGAATPAFGVTPMGGAGMETPTPGHLPQVCKVSQPTLNQHCLVHLDALMTLQQYLSGLSFQWALMHNQSKTGSVAPLMLHGVGATANDL